MDQVFDKISQEVPYDAVSNLVNASITSYKDGKDQGLVNGANDIDNKNSVIDRFYSNLTSDFIKQSDPNDPKTTHVIGKQIGRFLVDNQNNLIERTTEAFDNTTEQDTANNGMAVFKAMELMLKTNVIPMCSIYIKLNDGVRKLVKKGFASKIKTVTPKEGGAKTYLKNVINMKLGGDKQIDCPFDSLEDFLRDATNVFTRNSDDEKLYHRYTEIYNNTSEIVSKVAQSVNGLLENIRNIEDASDSDINKSFDKMVENSKEIHKLYDKLYHDANPDDFLAWLPQNYKMNIFTFAIKPIESSVDKYYEGMTKSDLERAKKTKVLQSADTHDKVICTSLNCPKSIDQMIREMQALFGNINSEAIMTRTKKSLFSILGNMTPPSFWEAVKNFNEASSKFAEKADDTILSLIESTIRCAKIIGTLGSYTLRSIDKIKNTSLKGKSLIISKLMLSVAGYACKDLTMVLSALHYINANDLVMKLYLYDTTNNYLTYIAECLK